MPAPVLSVDRMRQWEQASWEAGCSQGEVIARAGRAIAEAAQRLTQAGQTILILAGRGHNGDDARATEPHLRGRKVRLIEIASPADAWAEVESALAAGPALIVDGLFGIGLNRPLDAHWTELIERLNQSGIPILAIDVPSGLNAQTAEPQPVALCAQATVTLGAPKEGLLRPASHPFTGRLELASEIGLVPCPFTSELQWALPGDFSGFPPARRADGHKGTFGHVAIVAGSEGYHGAAVLAARGALRACPGLVTVYCARAVYQPVAAQLQAAMVHAWQADAGLPTTATALVAGPGLAAPDLGPALREFVNDQWLTSALPVIVDASALAWIEPGPTPLNSRRFLTPHPGEAARLLGIESKDVQENRVAALRELSRRYGNCWVVLKGHHTLIGRSSGDIHLNPTGNPWLGQGGSGDLLSGYLGGLLAQPKLQAQPLKTARYAVYNHGAAADTLTRRSTPWTIEELIPELGRAAI